jgi:hypothetical protein
MTTIGMQRATRLIIAMICSLGLASSQSAAVSLLVPGTFHGDEVRARTGERWTGLFPTPSGFAWRPAIITTRRVTDPTVDQNAEKTGVEVLVKGGSPVVLIKGIPGLTANKVRGIFHKPEGLDLPQSDPLPLVMADGRAYQLRVLDRRASNDAPQKASRLILETGSHKQVLYQWPTGLLDQHCELIWAGDLDGDGNLDLLMALSDHYNVTTYTLFLSSRRSAGTLVRQVAAFLTKGC